MNKNNSVNIRTARSRLLFYFRRNGYARFPNPKRKKEIGAKYKKGWEIRLVAKTKKELYLIGELLDEVGLKRRKPFKKGSQTVQPVYSKQAVV